MDPICVKKILEDYEQILQYYTLMITNNKMKNYDVESKEWWEVVKEYFIEELEKNLAQCIVDERTYRYKLEVY